MLVLVVVGTTVVVTAVDIEATEVEELDMVVPLLDVAKVVLLLEAVEVVADELA